LPNDWGLLQIIRTIADHLPVFACITVASRSPLMPSGSCCTFAALQLHEGQLDWTAPSER
jgi:hypothetical protein